MRDRGQVCQPQQQGAQTLKLHGIRIDNSNGMHYPDRRTQLNKLIK